MVLSPFACLEESAGLCVQLPATVAQSKLPFVVGAPCPHVPMLSRSRVSMHFDWASLVGLHELNSAVMLPVNIDLV